MQLGNFIVNNWPLFVALVIILFLLARTWVGPGAIKSIRPVEAVQLINHQDAVVVDVRTDKEFEEGHIMNALHIPLGVLNNRIPELQEYKSNPMILACRSGARSAQAVTTLKKQGFENVNNLSGGMLAWSSANLPVTAQPTKRQKPKKITQVKQESLNQVVVYSTRSCPFCTRAIDLLEDKGVGFTEYRIDENPELRVEMESRSQRTSVPQIFIGDVHVGGCDDMYELEDQGKLDSLIGLTARN